MLHLMAKQDKSFKARYLALLKRSTVVEFEFERPFIHVLCGVCGESEIPRLVRVC